MSESHKGCQTPKNWAPTKGSYPVMGSESLMCQKEHGSSKHPVQKDLRYGCDVKLADRICNFNRHYAEHSGYFLQTSWRKEVDRSGKATTYYDANSGRALFFCTSGSFLSRVFTRICGTWLA